jgi:hypothetical protein
VLVQLTSACSHTAFMCMCNVCGCRGFTEQLLYIYWYALRTQWLLFGDVACFTHPVAVTYAIKTFYVVHNRPPPSAEVLARIEANRQAALQRLREVAAARPKPVSPSTDTTATATDTTNSTTAAAGSTTAGTTAGATAAVDEDFDDDYEELMRGGAGSSNTATNNNNNNNSSGDPMQEELEAAMEMDFDFDDDYSSSTVTTAKSATATAAATATVAGSSNTTSSGAANGSGERSAAAETATGGATDMETDAVSRYIQVVISDELAQQLWYLLHRVEVVAVCTTLQYRSCKQSLLYMKKQCQSVLLTYMRCTLLLMILQ